MGVVPNLHVFWDFFFPCFFLSQIPKLYINFGILKSPNPKITNIYWDPKKIMAYGILGSQNLNSYIFFMILKSRNTQVFLGYHPKFLTCHFLSQKEAEEQRRIAKLQGKDNHQYYHTRSGGVRLQVRDGMGGIGRWALAWFLC